MSEAGMYEKPSDDEWERISQLAAAFTTMAEVNGEHAEMQPNHVLEAQILGLLMYVEAMRDPNVSREFAHQEVLESIRGRMKEAEANGTFNDDVEAQATHHEGGQA